MDNLRLYEVRLPNLVVVRVVTTTQLRALEMAIAHTPIKDTDAVTVIPMDNLIVDSRL